MDFSSVIKLHIKKSSSMSQLFLRASDYCMLHRRDMRQACIKKLLCGLPTSQSFISVFFLYICTFLPAFIITFSNHWITICTSRYPACLRLSAYTDIILSGNSHHSSFRLSCTMVGNAMLITIPFSCEVRSNVLQLILGLCATYLKNMLEVFSLGSQTSIPSN